MWRRVCVIPLSCAASSTFLTLSRLCGFPWQATALILGCNVSIFGGQAKYDAWTKRKGVARDAAMQR